MENGRFATSHASGMLDSNNRHKQRRIAPSCSAAYSSVACGEDRTQKVVCPSPCATQKQQQPTRLKIGDTQLRLHVVWMAQRGPQNFHPLLRTWRGRHPSTQSLLDLRCVQLRSSRPNRLAAPRLCSTLGSSRDAPEFENEPTTLPGEHDGRGRPALGCR